MNLRNQVKWIVFFFLPSCNYFKNTEGIYVAKNQTNIIDTIFLKKGIYTQKIHRTSDNSLVYSHTDRYLIKGDLINLENFYPDDDSPIDIDAESLDRFVISVELDFKIVGQKQRIYHQQYNSKTYFEKVDQ